MPTRHRTWKTEQKNGLTTNGISEREAFSSTQESRVIIGIFTEALKATLTTFVNDRSKLVQLKMLTYCNV